MHLSLALVWWVDWELTKRTDSMAASKILFLFQSAYVLRMKKPGWIRSETHIFTGERNVHSEKMTDAIPRPVRGKWLPSARTYIHERTLHVPEFILSNIRHFWKSHAVSRSFSLTLHSITYTCVPIRGKAHWRTSVNFSSGRCMLERNARYKFAARRTEGRYRVTI
jgi:hypothetical protein